MRLEGDFTVRHVDHEEFFPVANGRRIGPAFPATAVSRRQVVTVRRLETDRTVWVVDHRPGLPRAHRRTIGVNTAATAAVRRKETLPGQEPYLIARSRLP